MVWCGVVWWCGAVRCGGWSGVVQGSVGVGVG